MASHSYKQREVYLILPRTYILSPAYKNPPRPSRRVDGVRVSLQCDKMVLFEIVLLGEMRYNDECETFEVGGGMLWREY